MVTVREALEALTTQNLIDWAEGIPAPNASHDPSEEYRRGYENALSDLADLLQID